MKPLDDTYTDSELVIMLATLRRAINTVQEVMDKHEAIAWLEADERSVVRAMLNLGLKPDDVKELDL